MKLRFPSPKLLRVIGNLTKVDSMYRVLHGVPLPRIHMVAGRIEAYTIGLRIPCTDPSECMCDGMCESVNDKIAILCKRSSTWHFVVTVRLRIVEYFEARSVHCSCADMH